MEFFWGKISVFSNHCLSKYTLDGFEFNCVEQGMMYEKAKLFDPDGDEIKLIMKETDPSKIKKHGRNVKNYNDVIWSLNRGDLVYKHLKAKFTQNNLMKLALLNTGNKLMVEASPYDKIWGIGMNESDAKKCSAEKLNKALKSGNLLGKLLTKLREELK